MTDQALITAAIATTGLSPRQFGERLMSRNRRTVRNWLDGTSPLPPIAREWLEHWLSLSGRTHILIVRALTPPKRRAA